MPRGYGETRFALASRFDARAFTGALLTRGAGAGTTTSGTASWAAVHEDALDALHGRGSHVGWAAYLDGALTAGWTVGIDEDDRVYLEHSTTDFEVRPSADNAAFGFDPAGTGLAGGAAPFRHTAINDWTRGSLAGQLTIRQGATVLVPSNRMTAQGVVTMLRTRGFSLDDDDAGADSLEHLETVAHGADFRWGVDDDGHAFWEVEPVFASAADATPTWDDANLRDRLGFDGTETTTVTVDGNYRGVATYPLPGFIVPSRALDSFDASNDEESSSARRIDGALYSVCLGTYQHWSLRWWLDGRADAVDLHDHWLRYVVPYLHRGAPVNFYGDWGDPRRCGAGQRGLTYGLLHTVEAIGQRGRRRLALPESAAQAVEREGSLPRRFPMTLKFTERP